MSRQSINVLTLSLALTGTVTANRFVQGTGAQTGAAGNALGVARSGGATGEVIPVDVLGTAAVEAGAGISANALIQSDASGRAITRTSTNPILGRLAPGESAGAAGEFVEVILYQN